jgi:hypothetical protein
MPQAHKANVLPGDIVRLAPGRRRLEGRDRRRLTGDDSIAHVDDDSAVVGVRPRAKRNRPICRGGKPQGGAITVFRADREDRVASRCGLGKLDDAARLHRDGCAEDRQVVGDHDSAGP